jgi:hypothetical protein
MTPFIHLVWSPEDEGAGKWVSEPGLRLASETQFSASAPDAEAGDRAMSPAEPDAFFDDEAERQYEREQSMPPGGNLGGDIDHWRP